MKTSTLVLAAALALTTPAFAGGWAQTNPNGYTYGHGRRAIVLETDKS